MTFCASPSADHVKRESDCETYRQLLHGSTLDRTLLILAFHSESYALQGSSPRAILPPWVVSAVEGLSRRMLQRKVVSAETVLQLPF
jgi:hypothetical protein